MADAAKSWHLRCAHWPVTVDFATRRGISHRPLFFGHNFISGIGSNDWSTYFNETLPFGVFIAAGLLLLRNS